MGIDEIKNKLIKRSMENWGKQVKENAIVKHGKIQTCYIDFELKKVLLPPPREFCRHILS